MPYDLPGRNARTGPSAQGWSKLTRAAIVSAVGVSVTFGYTLNQALSSGGTTALMYAAVAALHLFVALGTVSVERGAGLRRVVADLSRYVVTMLRGLLTYAVAVTPHPTCFPTDEVTTDPDPPPRLLDVASLVAAPRPGPVAGATLAA